MRNRLDDVPVHQQVVLKMGVALFSGKASSVIELGNILIDNGSDDLCDGGVWIWQINNGQVYYSPKFCNSLGFEYGELGEGFGGFDRGDAHQMAYGMGLIDELIENKSQSIFVNRIDYFKKDNTILPVLCSGTVFYKYNAPYYIVGTHKLIQTDG